MMPAREIFHRRRRPLRASGQGAIASLRAGGRRRSGRHSGVEQIQPGAHDHRLRSRARFARPRMKRCGNWDGRSRITWMPTTSISTPWTAISPPAISLPSTSRLLSASPRSRRRHASSWRGIRNWRRVSQPQRTAEKYLDGCSGSRADLPAHRLRKRRGNLHHRSLHG